MENEDVIYILSVGGFQSEWPSNGRSENPHIIKIPNLKYLGKDGYFYKYCTTLHINTNTLAYKDIQHYINRTQPHPGEKRIGQISVQLQIIQTTLKTIESYNIMITRYSYSNNGNSLSIIFKRTIDQPSRKQMTDDELKTYLLINKN